MKIKEILTAEPWEDFLLDREHPPFLQSWAWGEFQEKLGLSHHRFGIYQKNSLVGVGLALSGQRRLGSFVYVPHGPVFEEFDKGLARATLGYLKNFAKKEGVDYLRVEPAWELSNEAKELFESEGFKKAGTPTIQAGGRTLLLDLNLEEKDLLMGLRKTTRYLIKKAEEAGVEVHRSSSPSMLGKFYRLMEVTKKRQGFVAHPTKYLQAQFEALAARRMAELSFASYKGDVLAAAISISYGDTVYYVHGASVRGDVPVSYALLWENIKEAKKDGLSYFDFWGIAPEGSSKRHPWFGYSLFKKGFGGYPVDYIGAWDLALTPRYLAVYAADLGRRVLRGV